MFTQSTFNEQFNQFTPDVFRDPLFGELRVFIDTRGECWFIGSEVASKFGYVNPHDAIKHHINPSLIIRKPSKMLGLSHPGIQEIVLIHERGLYALAGKSQLPGAIAFYEWVCEQIQDMRKYGVAMSPQFKTVMEIDEEQAYRAAQQRFIEQQNKIEDLQQQNNKLQGQVDLLSSAKPSVFHPLTQDERIELEELRELKNSFEYIHRYFN